MVFVPNVWRASIIRPPPEPVKNVSQVAYLVQIRFLVPPACRIMCSIRY